MGCTQSAQPTPRQQPALSSASSEASSKPKPLSEKEIQMRLDGAPGSARLQLAGVNYRYGWLSQRGYYPESLDKENQDAFSIIPQFGKVPDNQSFFAVYDGHGKDGHHCARFARDHLGKNILDKMDRIPIGGVNSKTIKQALTVAHYTTNEAMHSDKRFDDSLSGTTSISILLRGRAMYISNVGDSRAIVVSKTEDGRLVAKPLSSDQTPYRKDERERVKKYGARILSMDQIEGIEPIHENWGDLILGEDIDEGGDPPRVWSRNGDYPGTAFTRSLGDLFAEECGVIPEPEILEREIQPNDKYIVLASDGVFEFLTNQMVADMIARFEDPMDACKAIVEASYNMWLQYEVRTDDITVVLLYIDDVKKNATFTNSASFLNNDDSVVSPGGIKLSTSADQLNNASSPAPIELMQSRPVRREISREKRKHMIQLKADDVDDKTELSDQEIEALMTQKQAQEQEVLLSAMRTNFLFQHLTAQQRTAVVGVMRPVEVKKGDWIIRQGDAGDRFYVVDSGRFEVRVRGATSTAPPSIDENVNSANKDGFHNFGNLTESEKLALGGNPVHIYESGADQHPGFGELSLMYGKPRAASVIALTDGKLWSLDRRVFRRVVLRPKDYRKDIIRILKKVELLKCLNITQLQRLTDLMNEGSYSAGEYIIRQGEQGETFYVIVSGQCDCSIDSVNEETAEKESRVVMQLKDHNYFGERALLESKPRAANVIATTNTKVLYIGKAAFEEVLGPLAEIIDEDRERREALAAAELNAPHSVSDLHVRGIAMQDTMGPILLCTSKKSIAPGPQKQKSTRDINTLLNSDADMVTLRTILLSTVTKSELTQSAVRYVESVKALQRQQTLQNYRFSLLPQLLSSFQQPNAIHLAFRTAIVTDLSTFIRSNLNSFVENYDLVKYCFACIVAALERLHEANIVYRAVQPDSIFVDVNGKVVLMDYRFCKVGLYGSTKTFTICGASDYLSPEQISQVGHSYPVDLWGMGVFLFEATVGSHPFSAHSEVATYSKISSFGTKAFPALKFPENIDTDVKALINQLLVPNPEARIGAGDRGFVALRNHPYFQSTSWLEIEDDVAASPLKDLAQKEKTDLLEEGIEGSLLDSFDTVGRDVDLSWITSLEL